MIQKSLFNDSIKVKGRINYFIFVFNEGNYEDEGNLGQIFEFPDPDKGGYKFKRMG